MQLSTVISALATLLTVSSGQKVVGMYHTIAL